MMTAGAALTVHFAPLLPVPWLLATAGFAVFVLLLATWKNRNGMLLRSLAAAAFLLILCNPSLVEEERTPAGDIAVAVVDKSFSQSFGTRTERTARALTALKDSLQKEKNMELRVVEAPDEGKAAQETDLFTALERSFSDVPPSRRAGTVLLSDGQIHDIPQNPADFSKYGPVNLWLSGEKNEKDRRIVITQAPAYGIAGQSVQVKYRVEDTHIDQSPAAVTIDMHEGAPQVVFVMPGEEQTVEFPVTHPGQNVLELSTKALENEVTPFNNRAAIIVNGVRDRLKVLLVSGQPHAGGRTWRDLLTADPGVDLVHFTILRDPEKWDSTPQHEMALIAFPFQELFETKLYDFDLVIFDQYKLNRVLPDFYFKNIADYVREGGAFLEASGPSFAGPDSIYRTPLGQILPATPTGEITSGRFTPLLTESGRTHPVTAGLDQEKWGHWLRQIAVTQHSGDLLMTGANGLPLLMLDRVGKGRIAQLASDHIWLWSRGYDGGGPQAELLRRTIHWLMKEPELDEKALRAEIVGNTVLVRSGNYKLSDLSVTATKPGGVAVKLQLEKNSSGFLEQRLEALEPGIYSFEDSEGEKAYAVYGETSPPEMSGIITTAKHVQPVADASKGNVLWMEDAPSPRISFSGGRGSLHLRRNNAYEVTGVQEKPVMPAMAAVLLLLALLLAAWRREGRG